MSAVGWGFIGASIWAGERLVPAVRSVDRCEAVGVYSSDPERGARFARDQGLQRSYVSLEQLLGDPEIDAVYISSTNDLHASHAIAAVKAGKHVLCEKPVAISIDEALAIRQAAREAGVVVAVNHHLRGAATIGAMRRLIEEGAIGEIVAAGVSMLTSLRQDMRTWRLTRREAGAGVAMDLTVHVADTTRFLLGDEIVEVTALAANGGLAADGIEDSLLGAMRTSRGPLVSFHDSFTIPHAGNRLEIHGTEASLLARGVLGAEPVGEVSIRRDGRIIPVEVGSRWPLYEHAVARFAAAVRGEGLPLTSLEDGIAALAVALAALQSASEMRPVRPWHEGAAGA